MEIHLDAEIAKQSWASDAQQIVRNCVHCGFCNATCPTYQLLGHESDGPRGRIYLIKQLLEGEVASAATAAHLDRCLSCRACESTCPSGVKYAQLLDAGRELLDQQRPRSGIDGLKRKALCAVLPNVGLLQTGVKFASPLRQVLPAAMSSLLPAEGKNLSRSGSNHPRKMLLLEGCAQSALTPETNAAAVRVFDRLGVTLLSEADQGDGGGCCGAVRLHTSARDKGLADVKARIDSWWPRVQAQSVEAIISTASGCGVTVKDYGDLLKHDAEYAVKAAHISAITLDLSEAVASELAQQAAAPLAEKALKVAFHSPCTLQHGQRINGVVESILHQQGYRLLPVDDGHLCCGSADTYSLLQPAMSQRLKADKLDNLQCHAPELIVTANVGCQLHLRADASVPVVHWIELLDRDA